MSAVSKSSRARKMPRAHKHTAAVAVFIAVAGGAAASVSVNESAQAGPAVTAPVNANPAPAPIAAPLPLAAANPPMAQAEPAVASIYTNDLDGWIRQSLEILKEKGIPASYDGIKRNIMRESTGNPRAINLTDSNAAAGIPSKGLLQVIDPTFAAYHVPGTPFDIWDPVANIVAACNYAAHHYGSMDNVNSAY